jgi:hypothetical protein
VPGHIPGPLGYAAFAGVKFGGYVIAGVVLKKLVPAITAGAVKIAAARTGLGLVIGPLVTFGMAALMFHFNRNASDASSLWPLYGFLFVIRVVIWAGVIGLFTRGLDFAESKLWGYAAAGAAWSCLLDLPGFGLALISPGQTPIC